MTRAGEDLSVHPRWDVEADVVVVGYGAAGACAAIEAAHAGASVVVLDRFAGGGATAISGGVVYAGGGTAQQRECGAEDSAGAMFEYLRLETRGVVSDQTLREFCEQSAATLRWLEDQGVPFDGRLCPYKTSYPTNDYYLYYSGNELSHPFRDVATPAPRGHRPKARGTSGHTLFAGLARAVRRRGIDVRPQTKAERLVTDDEGRVVGVECRTLSAEPLPVRAAHRVLSQWCGKPSIYFRPLGKMLARPVQRLEQRNGRPLRVRARRGVVIAAGGFVLNRPMVREHAPAYSGGLPLGTLGDDGSGIRLGTEAGGATDRMARMTAWRFINPPSALAKGLLVDRSGARVCNEYLYGAAIGDAMVRDHGGHAYLVIDDAVLQEARRQVPDQTLLFQRVQARFILGAGKVSAATLDGLADLAGIDIGGLERTVADYNADIASGKPDAMGKPHDQVQPVEQGPFHLIDCSVRASSRFPLPVMTMGGLKVDERTGAVRGDDGGAVPGLYAAGRSAVGICSDSYVTGLSIADCVFSGRRAGRSAGARPDVPSQKETR